MTVPTEQACQNSEQNLTDDRYVQKKEEIENKSGQGKDCAPYRKRVTEGMSTLSDNNQIIHLRELLYDSK